MLRDLPWRLLALVLCRPFVFNWLKRRGERTPYIHLGPMHDRYMFRYWLFNPYSKAPDGSYPARWSWLPNIRLHHIMRADADRHLHDHPWNARTFVLRGFYLEERKGDLFNQGDEGVRILRDEHGKFAGHREIWRRSAGYTGRLLFGEYHRISHIPPGGVWTLFITWKFRGDWGFDVDGVKIPHTEYLKKNDI